MRLLAALALPVSLVVLSPLACSSSGGTSACSCTITESGQTKTTACETPVCIGTIQYFCGMNEDVTQTGECPDNDAGPTAGEEGGTGCANGATKGGDCASSCSSIPTKDSMTLWCGSICDSEQGCASGFACNTSSAICTTACTSNAQCTSSLWIDCNMAGGYCE